VGTDLCMTAIPRAARLVDAYDPAGEVDLRGFSGSLATFAVASVGVALVARASGRAPERYALTDVLVGGLATHKFSRLLARGSVTSPVRAPFTEFSGAAGSAEHDERPRGDSGVRHTVGELLTCPFCLGVWTAAAYVAGIALAPRPTRAWAATFAVTAVSDFLQHTYSRVRGD
jgi:uncharacterized protein DUF1360